MKSVPSIRRGLSGTPLARRYEESLAGQRRSRPKIPWDRFVPSSYPRAALELAGDAAHRLAEGEYHAIGLFSRITSGLAMMGAPFDLLCSATRVAGDELRHADYCTRFAALCSGNEPVLILDSAALAAAAPVLPGAAEVDFLVAKYVATGETLAAALLLACRRRAKDPVARALFSSLLGDEIRHARLGWYYLAWRAPQWTQAEKQAVADPLGEFVASIERALWFGRDAPDSARAAADALGVLDSESQRAVVRDVMEREILPGLDAVGLGASHAWRNRPRGETASPLGVARELVFAGPASVRAEARASLAPARMSLRPLSNDPVDRAAAWLASQVDEHGSVAFSLDARTRVRASTGPMHHGRAAIVVRALAAHRGYPDVLARAKRRLEADLALGLSGKEVPGWPADPVLVAATLALAGLAGLDIRAVLAEQARAPELRRAPWYAAEVAAALGPEAPDGLFDACVAALDADPWAPWTAIAARARRATEVAKRADLGLISAVQQDGSVLGPAGPEIPRAAVTVEALAPFATDGARAAAGRAVRFLERAQLAELVEPEHPASIDGAFPLTPTSDELRVDATAHAVLALIVWRALPR